MVNIKKRGNVYQYQFEIAPVNGTRKYITTLIVIGAIVISVISIIKENNNFSMVDTIKNIVKFKMTQKDYRYKGIERYNQNSNTKF